MASLARSELGPLAAGPALGAGGGEKAERDPAGGGPVEEVGPVRLTSRLRLMTYGLFGGFTAQPGTRDELVGYLLEAATVLEANPGCLQYVVSTSADPDAVHVFELWTDQAAHDASLEPQEIRDIISRARPLIAGMSGQTQLTVCGGKGVPV